MITPAALSKVRTQTDEPEAGQIIKRARSVNPSIDVVARAHSDAEVEYLKHHGAGIVIMGEREVARRMIEHAVERN